MSLQPRRPPGHGKRKALVYALDIMNLRRAGHSYASIRDALEDAGVRVTISTVRREVLKGAASPPAAVAAGVAEPASTLPTRLREVSAPCGATAAVARPPATQAEAPLPGKSIAEAFMRGRPTNPLFLEEPPP
jgi:hypothetical protein